jgi:ubiquinone/menaquinone biosynthesis C-methylase UbiE
VTVTDPFEAIAPFYDLDVHEHDEDLPFYRQIVEMHGSAVLELGCGTGRVAIDLAEAGATVTGIDISGAMLDRARTRAATSGVEAEWIAADLLTFALGRRFDAVLLPLGTIQHLTSASQIASALERAAAHLSSDGALVVDLEAPHGDDFNPGPLPLMEHWTRAWPEGGGQVTKLVAVDVAPSEALRYVTWHFDVQPAEGPLTRVSSQFTLRTTTLGEIELAGRLAGLEVVGAYGDYEFGPFEDGDPRLVVVLQHAHEDDGDGGGGA